MRRAAKVDKNQSEIERRKDAESDLVRVNDTIAEMRRALEMAGRGVGL